MQTIDDSDLWLHEPLCIRLLCEHDSGCHLTESANDVISLGHLSAHEKRELMQGWAAYMLRVDGLLRHSEIELNWHRHPEGRHLTLFLNKVRSKRRLKIFQLVNA